MLDKFLSKILNYFINSNLFHSLEKSKNLKGIIEKFKDLEFMIHIMKYLIFGILTTIISLGSFWLLITFCNLNENICNFLSIVIGILSAYVLNRKYVFESKEKNLLQEFAKFVMARVFSSLFDMATFFIFATLLSMPEMPVKIIISVIVVILNYVLSKLLVFQKN